MGPCNYKQTGPDASFKVCLFVHLLVSQWWKSDSSAQGWPPYLPVTL